MSSEMCILALLGASGLVGIVSNNAIVTATLFVGGFLMWACFTLPECLKPSQPSKPAPEADASKAAAAAAKSDDAAAAAAALPLPAPDAVMSLIKRRRSVFPRDYSGEEVPREQVEMLLEAANWAPTHGMTEPWRFVVLRGASKTAMEDLTLELCRTRLAPEQAAKTLEKLEKKRGSTWGKVSCYIAICCKRQAKPGKMMPEWEEMAAVSCAVQNMYLMSTSLGLGGYWSSWQEVARESPEMKELLGLSPEDRVMGFFTLGRV
ncbi:hypothetical protein Agub_g12979, partial [Astrephomene gubernaculifera]